MIDWLEKLRLSDKLVVVEGKNDERALRELGMCNVVAISRKPLFKFIEDISLSNKEVVLLTDLDREGRKLYSKLKHGFQRHGVKVDSMFRESLFRNTHLAHIEGISSYYNRNMPVFR